MGFYRTRTIKNRQYLYYEERWREGRKVRSRSYLVKSFGPVAAAQMTVGLPFMIAYDLISGQRLKEMKEEMARGRSRGTNLKVVHDPRRVQSERDWEVRRSLMSRAEFERYMAHAKAEIASGKYETNTEAMKAARTTHAVSLDARDKAAKEADMASDEEGG